MYRILNFDELISDINKRFYINEQNTKLNQLRGDMSVKFHEIITSIVKKFNERCNEFIDSQKQSMEKIKIKYGKQI